MTCTIDFDKGFEWEEVSVGIDGLWVLHLF